MLGMGVGVALVQAAVIMYRDLQAFVASAHLRVRASEHNHAVEGRGLAVTLHHALPAQA